MANQYNAIFNAIVRADAGQAVTELRRVDGQIEKTTTTAASRFSQFGVLAKGAIVGIGAAAAGSFARDAVQAASSLEESINAVRVTLGEAADDVLALGKNSVDAYGLSERAFNQFAASFSGFAETIAGPGGDVAAIIDELATRAADLASVRDIPLAEAVQVFQSTLAGESEPLRRLGFGFDAAAVSAFLLEEGVVSSKNAITEADKVLGRYELLMRNTSETAGDFANTSDSLANSQRRLAASYENTQANLGQRAAPLLAQVNEFALDVLGVVNEVLDKVEQIDKDTGFDLFSNLFNLPKEFYELAMNPPWKDAGDDAEQEYEQATGAVRNFAWTARLEWGKTSNDVVINSAKMRREAGAALVEMADDARDLSAAIRAVDSAFLAATSRNLDLQQQADSVGEAVQAYRDLLDGSSALEERRSDALRGVQSAQDRYNDALRRNHEIVNGVAATEDERADALRNVESAQRRLSDAQAKYNALLEGSVELERERRDLALAARDAEFDQRDAAAAVRDLEEGSVELENRRRDAAVAVAEAQDAVRRAAERAYSNIPITEQLSALVDLQAAQDKLLDAQQAADALGPNSVELAEERAKATFELEKAQAKLEGASVDYNDTLAGATALERRRQEALFNLRSAESSYRQTIVDSERAVRGSIATDAERRDALRNVELAQRDLQRAQQDYNNLQPGSRALEEERRQALLASKQAVIEFAAEVGRVPRETVASIIADLDEGSVVTAVNELQRIANQATARVTLQAQSGGFGTAGVAFNQSLGAAAFGGVNLPAGSGNVTVVNNFNGVVGDPVAVGRQVASVLNSYRAAGGVVRY